MNREEIVKLLVDIFLFMTILFGFTSLSLQMCVKMCHIQLPL